jgi:phosphatidylglycerophosphatase A
MLAKLIATGFGSGLVRGAPGTAGSLVAALLAVPLLAVSPWALALALLASCVAGWWAIPRAGGEHDPGWVVIDEFAGQFLTLLVLPGPSIGGIVAGFLLFRAFDILKPGPIDRIQRLSGATGVMADDLLAGLAAAACLSGLHFAFPALFQ